MKHKPVVANVQKFFVISLEVPTRRVREIDALVVVTEKRSWAEEASGKRHLIGASAFHTLPSAERAKAGALTKIVEQTFLRRMPRTSGMWSYADQQLRLFDQLGTFDLKGRKPN